MQTLWTDMKSSEEQTPNKVIVPAFMSVCVIASLIILIRRYIKKKLFNKKVGWNPPEGMLYSDRWYHTFIRKLAAMKKLEAVKAVETFNRNISRRNKWIRHVKLP